MTLQMKLHSVERTEHARRGLKQAFVAEGEPLFKFEIKTAPFEPKNEIGRRAKTLHDSLEIFKGYWFGRDARKTNDRLINFSSKAMVVYCFIVALETHCTTNFNRDYVVKMLSEMSVNQLKSVLRLPNKNNSEDRERLSKAKTGILESWSALKELV
jgi:hypothetical protein